MAYGREVLTNALRKAGEELRSFDDAYSQKVAAMYSGANPGVQAAAYVVGGAHPSLRKGQVDRVYGPETRMQQVGRTAMEYALPAANAVPKYVLPATGVTVAGKGLIDIATALGGGSDQQTEGTLTL